MYACSTYTPIHPSPKSLRGNFEKGNRQKWVYPLLPRKSGYSKICFSEATLYGAWWNLKHFVASHTAHPTAPLCASCIWCWWLAHIGCGCGQTSTPPLGNGGDAHHKVGVKSVAQPLVTNALVCRFSRNLQPNFPRVCHRQANGLLLQVVEVGPVRLEFMSITSFPPTSSTHKTPADVRAGSVVRSTPSVGGDVLRSSNLSWAHGAPLIFVVEWRSPPQVSVMRREVNDLTRPFSSSQVVLHAIFVASHDKLG